MRFLLSLLIFLSTAPALTAQPAEPDTIYPGRDLTPVLPYIFFDSGSAVIPARYRQFDSTRLKLLPARGWPEFPSN